ncbi:DUF4176 domain-containing protein [Enterococcus faecium]|nr:DUF4176 domain-containing protein [Enterococcus faecium]EGP5130046.1 DUF4176 domain-containing protein [Enterococcus faecium]EGP5496408.1 DUF4176 domain-containing protein [Enterococcus faecium]EME3503845.1 DUF4176 domain-containing protein [Enterococcus faecium]EME3544478.1 DUF4176 domain-containing protein [Enterococcus faecium]
MNSEKLEFLGLGSMIEVDDMDALLDTKYVVIARAIGKDSKENTILRYMIAPHPFGDIPSKKGNILTISESQVKKVLTHGYLDEKDDALFDELLTKMNQSIRNQTSSSMPNFKTEADNLKEQKKIELQAQEAKKLENDRLEKEHALLRRDPFYKFRKRGLNDG